VFFLVTACYSNEPGYLELITHPYLLEKKYKECLYNTSSECDIVRKAAFDFNTLYRERDENQEEFGMKIIHAQFDLVKKAKELVLAKGEAKIQLGKEYQEDYQKIQAMLAVIKQSDSPQ